MANSEKSLNLSDFQSEEDCMAYLSELKWSGSYKCRKCGHTNYCSGKTPFSRRCTKCKHEESARAHTIFHRCRIPLLEGFKLISEVCSNPDISTYKLSEIMERRQMTCWRFKKRVTECIEKNGCLKLFEPGG